MCAKMINYYYKREDVKKESNDYIGEEKDFCKKDGKEEKQGIIIAKK